MKLTRPLFLFLAMSLAVMLAPSCGSTNCKDPANASSVKCTAISAVVACGGSAVDSLVTEQGPGLEHALGSAVLGDGSIDYNAAQPVLEDYAIKFGMCFVSQVFDRLSSIKLAAAPGGSGTPHPSPAALHDTYEKFRATHYTGKTFQAAGSGQ